MELLDRLFAARILGLAAGFNPNTLRTLDADFHTKQKLEHFIEANRHTQGYYLAEGNFNQTPNKIAALIDELRPDIVYIDASYLVSPNASNKAKWEKLSEVGEDIKKIAMEYDVPIFQTMQFNREAEQKKTYGLANIAGGDFTGQLGSVVLGIQKGTGMFEETRRKITVSKNRDGDQTEFEINFTFTPPNFDEVNPESSPSMADDDDFEI